MDSAQEQNQGIRRQVSSRDVARLAGVSRSAVSRTFTDGASVSVATREKVLAAARTLGYRPNAIARSLITRESKMIGLVMADITNPFYAHVLETLSEKLQQRGMSLLVFSARSASQLDELVPRLLAYQVDSVIITSATLSSSLAKQCAVAGRRVLMLNRYTDHGQIDAVACDNVAAGRAIADLLLDAGHRHFGFVAGVQDTSSSRDRETGFGSRLQERAATVPLRAVGNYSYAGGTEAARALLLRDRRPDAIFCANDMMALAAIDVARSVLGLRIPEDLSIVGFDNAPVAALSAYDLTTFDQDIETMTEEAVAVILGDLHGPQRPVRRLVPGRIVLRGSVRRC